MPLSRAEVYGCQAKMFLWRRRRMSPQRESATPVIDAHAIIIYRRSHPFITSGVAVRLFPDSVSAARSFRVCCIVFPAKNGGDAPFTSAALVSAEEAVSPLWRRRVSAAAAEGQA